MGKEMGKRVKVRIATLLVTVLLAAPSGWGDITEWNPLKLQSPHKTNVGTQICRMLESGERSVRFESVHEEIEAGEDVLRFYRTNDCLPAWSSGYGMDFKTLLLIGAIRNAVFDGLESGDRAYNLESVLALLETMRKNGSLKNDPVFLAKLDILLTDGYIMLGKHLHAGVVRGQKPFEEWVDRAKPLPDMASRLHRALRENAVSQSLESLAPSDTEYRTLKQMLLRYRQIEERGGWAPIVFVPKPGERTRIAPHDAIADEIRKRLWIEGDLMEDGNSTEGYHAAVIAFQKRHGLEADGVVGKETLKRLNVPAGEKILSIRANMERRRWLTPRDENPRIVVNIPDFSLRVVNDGHMVFGMKAIVGREERATPVFSSNMTYLVVNPYWHVPSTILREDIFPKVRKSISYLSKERLKVIDARGQEINPYAINWKQANPRRFPYILRQEPGEKNSLGRLKFMFPNSHDVYIHDTPYKTLFDKTARGFSSGCIRVEEPLKLAHYLLANDGKSIDVCGLMESEKNKHISLSKPVKVYIDYWTVGVDANGRAMFFDDLYGHDRTLLGLLGWGDRGK